MGLMTGVGRDGKVMFWMGVRKRGTDLFLFEGRIF
jgi:hypothetical protein